MQLNHFNFIRNFNFAKFLLIFYFTISEIVRYGNGNYISKELLCDPNVLTTLLSISMLAFKIVWGANGSAMRGFVRKIISVTNLGRKNKFCVTKFFSQFKLRLKLSSSTLSSFLYKRRVSSSSGMRWLQLSSFQLLGSGMWSASCNIIIRTKFVLKN